MRNRDTSSAVLVTAWSESFSDWVVLVSTPREWTYRVNWLRLLPSRLRETRRSAINCLSTTMQGFDESDVHFERTYSLTLTFASWAFSLMWSKSDWLSRIVSQDCFFIWSLLTKWGRNWGRNWGQKRGQNGGLWLLISVLKKTTNLYSKA